MKRRVVITGGSMISPIGRTRGEVTDALLNGKSGVKKLRPDELLTKYIHSGVFGSVDYPIAYDFERRFRKTMGPVSYYACQTAKETLEASGLSDDFIRSGRLGVAFGSTHGSPTTQRDIYRNFYTGEKKNYKSIGAVEYLKSMVHTTAVNITKMFGITGRVISSSTACTTSSQSIGFGYETIKFGIQDAMLCGGADEYDTTTVAVFDNLLACSTAYNDTPHLTPRPFDEKRDGLVVGEGGCTILLEEYEFAKKRGAPILGEIIGFACNNNGGDLILPNMEGIRATMRIGLKDAGISPDDVDLVSAHATATKMGDVIESQAIHSVYGNRPFVTALKSYTGHTMATCGAIETMLALFMMEDGFIAPTLNLTKVDKRCSMIRHVREVLSEKPGITAIQNFAFGGVNTSIIIKKPE